jgi:hypothetical protein
MRSTHARKRSVAAATSLLGSSFAAPVCAEGVSDAATGKQEEATLVAEVADSQGFLFYPSAPPAGAFRFALGGSYDAIDPAVMYGANVRFPQLTLDALRALGRGFSLKAHLNSMLVTSELLFGVGFAYEARPWAFELSTSVGLYVGRLDAFGFDAWLLSPEYRPELTAGYDFGELSVSLRASLLLMGPARANVGGVWGGLDNANVFVGHSEMLYVENPTRSHSVWYFGAGVLTTRAYYAFWVLFPDSPALYSYPRIVAGYEY